MATKIGTIKNRNGSLVLGSKGGRRSPGDRYRFVLETDENGKDRMMTESDPLCAMILFSDIEAIVIEHGCFGRTRLERTLNGFWAVWDSTIPGWESLREVQFENPDDAVSFLMH